MFINVNLDLVRSSKTRLANLGVRFCPVRKLICPVQLCPTVPPGSDLSKRESPGSAVLVVGSLHRMRRIFASGCYWIPVIYGARAIFFSIQEQDR